MRRRRPTQKCVFASVPVPSIPTVHLTTIVVVVVVRHPVLLALEEKVEDIPAPLENY